MINNTVIYAVIGAACLGGVCGYNVAATLYRLEATRLLAETQEKTIGLQKNVIGHERLSGEITNKIGVDYAKTFAVIDSLYSVPADNLPGNGMPTIPHSPGGIDGGLVSKQYKLTSKQCDVSRAKLIGLREWVKEQRKLSE